MNKRRYIPEPNDPNYREYALFWNSVSNAVLNTADIINQATGIPVWVPLTTRGKVIENAWLYLIDQREGTCNHGPDYGGTCMTCGYVVFTRGPDDECIFPDDEASQCTTTQMMPPAPDESSATTSRSNSSTNNESSTETTGNAPTATGQSN